MNRFNLIIASPLSGKELIQLLQQYPELTVQHIGLKRTYKRYPPLTDEQLKLFKIYNQMRIPAKHIFMLLGQDLLAKRAQRKAAVYRRKLGLPPRQMGKEGNRLYNQHISKILE